jgi:hypothetical protein
MRLFSAVVLLGQKSVQELFFLQCLYHARVRRAGHNSLPGGRWICWNAFTQLLARSNELALVLGGRQAGPFLAGRKHLGGTFVMKNRRRFASLRHGWQQVGTLSPVTQDEVSASCEPW